MRKTWTEQEIIFLKDNRLKLSFDQLAHHFERTRLSIKNKCKRLRLVRPKYYLNLDLTPSLSYILGCLCGDASILQNGIRLGVTDEDFANEFKRHCENILHPFFIKITKFNSGGDWYVQAGSLAFKNFVINKYGWFRTESWKVPDELFNSDPVIIGHFLRGFFDSEGNVHNYQIRVQTICHMEGIGELLARLGIKYSLKIANRKTVSGNTVYSLRISSWENMLIFKDKIGFSIQRKQLRLEEELNRPKIKKSIWLGAHKQMLTKLHKEGNSFQDIASMFSIGSAMTIRKYVLLADA